VTRKTWLGASSDLISHIQVVGDSHASSRPAFIDALQCIEERAALRLTTSPCISGDIATFLGWSQISSVDSKQKCSFTLKSTVEGWTLGRCHAARFPATNSIRLQKLALQSSIDEVYFCRIGAYGTSISHVFSYMSSRSMKCPSSVYSWRSHQFGFQTRTKHIHPCFDSCYHT
jgi:hypothetical protein